MGEDMKRKIILFLTIIFSIACMSFIASCDGASGNKIEVPKTEEKTYLSLSDSKLNLIIGENKKMTASYSIIPNAKLAYAIDNSQVASISAQGEVVALAEGEATITATYGNLTSTCSLVVTRGGFVPEIKMSGYDENKEVNAYVVGLDSNLGARIKFNNAFYDDATFTYTVSNPEIAEVVNGVLKGKTIGTTEIIVSASWRNIKDVIQPITLTVSFKANAYISIEGGLNEISLYTHSQFEGNTFEKVKDLDIVAQENGKDKDYTIKVIKGNDCISQNGKNITGIKAGVATIEVSFINDYQETVTQRLDIIVRKPYREIDNKVFLISKKDGTLLSNDLNSLFTSDKVLAGAENEYNESIFENGKITDIQVDYSMPIQTLYVYNSTVGYKIKAKIYTDIITTAEEFNGIIPCYTETDKGISGAYILMNDIDLGNVSYGIWKDANADRTEFDHLYFEGILDGNGHIVSNFNTTMSSGMFYNIRANSKIENIAFKCNKALMNSKLLAVKAGDDVTFKNIYVEYLENSQLFRGGSAGVVGQVGNKTKLTNVIVNLPNYAGYVEPSGKWTSKVSYGMVLFNQQSSTMQSIMENVFVVADSGDEGVPLLVDYSGNVYVASNNVGSVDVMLKAGDNPDDAGTVRTVKGAYHYQGINQILEDEIYTKYVSNNEENHWCFDGGGGIYWGVDTFASGDYDWQEIIYSAKDGLDKWDGKTIKSAVGNDGREYCIGGKIQIPNNTANIIYKKLHVTTSDNKTYYLNAKVYTDIITTTEEFNAIVPCYTGTDTAVTGAYILMNDIDLGNVNYGIWKEGNAYSHLYFDGILDGNGHIVSNFNTTMSSGMFYNIRANSRIENIAFKCNKALMNSKLLALSTGENVIVNNIYVEYVENSQLFRGGSAGVIGQMGARSKLTNIIVNLPNYAGYVEPSGSWTNKVSYGMVFFNQSSSTLQTVMENVFVLASSGEEGVPLYVDYSGNVYVASNDNGNVDAMLKAGDNPNENGQKKQLAGSYLFRDVNEILTDKTYNKYASNSLESHWCLDAGGGVYWGIDSFASGDYDWQDVIYSAKDGLSTYDGKTIKTAKDNTGKEYCVGGKIVIENDTASVIYKNLQVATTDNTVYYLRIKAYTDIITTIEEFNAIVPGYAGTDKGITGAYILGNDIDANGSIYGLWKSGNVYDHLYFDGVLDGNGYTVSNFKLMNQTGLFYLIKANSEIKNIGFKVNANNHNSRLLGMTTEANVIIDNIYIEYIDNEFLFRGGAAGVIGKVGTNTKLSNIIVNLPNYSGHKIHQLNPNWNQRVECGVLVSIPSSSTIQSIMQNVYVIANTSEAVPLYVAYSGSVYVASNNVGETSLVLSNVDNPNETGNVISLAGTYHFTSIDAMKNASEFSGYKGTWCK